MATNVRFGSYKSSSAKVNLVDIHIGVFFDGTRNNRTNSRIAGQTEENKDYNYDISEKQLQAYRQQIPSDKLNRNQHAEQSQSSEKQVKTKKLDEAESWNNDLSNIARLEKHYKKEKYSFSFYIEGIGTMDAVKDSMEGFTMGSGQYGILEKVKKANGRILESIDDLYTLNKLDKAKVRIFFDVYGFSRGAATARHFVAKIKGNIYDELTKGYNNIVKQEVRFLGLFDTVSSYDPTLELDKLLASKGNLALNEAMKDFFNSDLKTAVLLNNLKQIDFEQRLIKMMTSFVQHIKKKGFENDVAELNLRDLGEAKDIVHFTASDEHRQFFAVTTALGQKKCIEMAFPGAHSDIGGSYIHNAPEQKTIMDSFSLILSEFLLSLNRPDEKQEDLFLSDKQNLIRGGWFDEHEIMMGKPILENIVLNSLQSLCSALKIAIPSKLAYLNTTSTKKKISNRYSYIFLYLMAEQTNLKAEIEVINLEDLKEEFVLPDGKNDSYYKVNLVEVADMYRNQLKVAREFQNVKAGDAIHRYADYLNFDPTVNQLMWFCRNDGASYNRKSSEDKRINSKVIDMGKLAKLLKKTEAETRVIVDKQLLVMELRHRYFHFSSDASLGCLPRMYYRENAEPRNYKYDIGRIRQTL